MKLVILPFLFLSLMGCSVRMAAEKHGVNLKEITRCQDELCILAMRDTEVITDKESEDGRIVTYRSKKRKGSTTRAVFYGVMDVATLGLWELAGTPLEGALNNRDFYVYRVTYDEEGIILKSTINDND